MPSSNWLDTLRRWRQLPEVEQRSRRWRMIPTSVSQSMAFSGEPVDVAMLEETHAQVQPPWFAHSSEITTPSGD
ncbi:MAG: hypothetical protein COX57_07675 [Alphaproteobacteria bacterium CG_4_10_14_0_2_um_filter_63_37]|nr:MAG: hypothetical protein AUJ55_04660 [Proteobacteria bacterium CG1_02_64_396]PJA24630.1 MAG: hypothetical protein COX57_07675 [Alphaproteobacteria bacterium CG_4_10_14_0_2_um_filter_63_37]